MEVSDQIHALTALPLKVKDRRYSLYGGLGGPHIRSGRYGKVKR
jgi:hypothetical protein